MFKDIQKQLLLKFPLLWNTKFVPMLIVGITLNFIYFIIGYADGTINFKKPYTEHFEFAYYSFAVLITVLVFIVWLVNYFKNNSFKLFYPKSKNALFFEWIQILTIVSVLSFFYFSYELGKNFHKKSYFSKEEVLKKSEIISKGSFFIDAPYNSAEIDSVNSVFEYQEVKGQPVSRNIVYKDYVYIFGKKFSANSLINRKISDVYNSNKINDSIATKKMQKLLFENRFGEVKQIMNDYFKILNQHNLNTNLTPEKWFNITYDFPNFEKYQYIKPYVSKDNEYVGKSNNNYYNEEYTESATVDVASNASYSEYEIDHNLLEDNYDEIARAHTDTIFRSHEFAVFFYIVFILSIVIFSFRVTSGKSWLIALVSLGILNLAFGIFSAIGSEFLFYPIMVCLTYFILLAYFLLTASNKQSLGYSKIVLNLLLWTFMSILPLIYMLLLEATEKDQNNNYTNDYVQTPFHKFLSDNADLMSYLNIAISIFIMFLFSRVIRNWKAIAEE